MKIEKISDDQIKCTLTREDLISRHIKLSELAYGSDKAKILFRDMIRQASCEVGFSADDIPLMIEAIPHSSDSITLIITKIEYPEELDTRFSSFSPFLEPEAYLDPQLEGAQLIPNDIPLDEPGLFEKPQAVQPDNELEDATFIPLDQAVANGFPKKKDIEARIKEQQELAAKTEVKKLFTFNDLSSLIRISHILGSYYRGRNSLYKNTKSEKYYLVVSKNTHTPEEFNKVCNVLSEYGRNETFTTPAEAYFSEHYKPLIMSNAMQTLYTIRK